MSLDAFTVIDTGRAVFGLAWRGPLARALAQHTGGEAYAIERKLERLSGRVRGGSREPVDPRWRAALCCIVLSALKDGDRRAELIAAGERLQRSENAAG